jgi:hypothetical protein
MVPIPARRAFPHPVGSSVVPVLAEVYAFVAFIVGVLVAGVAYLMLGAPGCSACEHCDREAARRGRYTGRHRRF